MKTIFYCLTIFILLESCNEQSNNRTTETSTLNDSQNKGVTDTRNGYVKNIIAKLDLKRQLIKLGHHINTSANEYLPILSTDETKLFFSGMDRTGFFDFKQDFTKQKSSGGEDVFCSEFKDGIWSDARPIRFLNTNKHETISQVLKNSNLIMAANYPENYGSTNEKDGTQTTDIFLAKNKKSRLYQFYHFPEPVNSIYNEADGIIAEDESFILFVSDRPGNIGEFHKKGWKWNDSFWGNTDVFVSVKDGELWSVPISLGKVVNTAGAERTPWLSSDGLTLYISSNGHKLNKSDLDIYAFKRYDKNNWTDWQGPISITDANSDLDDWGYKETKTGNAYLARAVPLGFKPTQGGSAGDGGIRETNFRSGYEVFGQQVAALNSENTTDIYFLKKIEQPIFSLPELYFDLNSATLKSTMIKPLERLVDLINQNKNFAIQIQGYTDDSGNTDYNLNLSQKRADAVKNYLLQNNILNSIETKGFGANNPKFKNDNLKSKNRRVEIHFINKK